VATGFEVKKIFSSLLGEEQARRSQTDSEKADEKNQQKESIELLREIKHNTTADDQSTLAHQTEKQHEELVRILRKGFKLDEAGQDASKLPSVRPDQDSGGSFGLGGILDSAGTFILGPALYGIVKKFGRGLSKAASLSLAGLKKIPGVAGIIEKASAGLAAGGSVLMKGARLLGKLALPVTAIVGAFDAWKGFDSEKAIQLFGTDTVLSKVGSAVSHLVSGLLFNLVSPEQVAEGMKWLNSVGEEAGRTAMALFQSLMNSVTETLTELIGEDNIKAISDTLMAPIRYVSKAAEKVLEYIEQKVKEYLPDWVVDGISAVGGAVREGADTVSGWATRAGSAVGEAWDSATSTVSGWFGGNDDKDKPASTPTSTPIAATGYGGSAAAVGAKLPERTEAVIEAKAAQYGLDPATMKAYAYMESRGDPNAVSPTGATGVYQFTKGTAKGYGLKDRTNLEDNVDAGMRLALDNAKALSRRLGIDVKDVTPEMLYLAHQQGAAGAAVILKAAAEGKDISDLPAHIRRNVSVNYGGKSRTAAEFVAANSAKIQQYRAAFDPASAQQPNGAAQPTALAASEEYKPANPVAPVPDVSPEGNSGRSGGAAAGPEGLSSPELSLSSLPAVPNDEKLALINMGIVG